MDPGTDYSSRNFAFGPGFCRRKILSNSASSRSTNAVLEATTREHQTKPKHIISDKGAQFFNEDGDTEYQLWCKRENVKPRFGKIGEHGSIAIVERFIRTLKDLLRGLIVPYCYVAMQQELVHTMEWFNAWWPHEALAGKTPDEVYFARAPENEQPRLEPRPKWPAKSPCAAPQAPVRGSPGVKIEIEVTYHAGRRHLPILTVKDAA